MAISSINTDFNIHFTKNNFTDDISVVRDVYSIRQSLINIILTIPGEKPFKRDFGTIINDSLFENFNYAASIGVIEEIKFTIRKYEPRIRLEDVILDSVPISEESSIVAGHTESSSRAIVSDNNQLFLYISYFLLKGLGSDNSFRDSISIGLTKAR